MELGEMKRNTSNWSNFACFYVARFHSVSWAFLSFKIRGLKTNQRAFHVHQSSARRVQIVYGTPTLYHEFSSCSIRRITNNITTCNRWADPNTSPWDVSDSWLRLSVCLSVGRTDGPMHIAPLEPVHTILLHHGALVFHGNYQPINRSRQSPYSAVYTVDRCRTWYGRNSRA